MSKFRVSGFEFKHPHPFVRCPPRLADNLKPETGNSKLFPPPANHPAPAPIAETPAPGGRYTPRGPPVSADATLVRRWGCALGVVISASHNPAEDNGIKLVSPQGFKIPDAAEDAVEKRHAAGAPPAPGARGSRAGGTVDAELPRGLRPPGTPEERRFSQVYAEDRVGPMPYPNQANPDVAAARGRVRALVADLLPGGVDEGTGAALDPLIASWASGWLARIDSEHADHHAVVDRLIGAGVGGLVPGGSTGEFTTLSTAERKQLVELTVKSAAGRVPVIAGCGSNDTAHALMHMRFSKQAGAAAGASAAAFLRAGSCSKYSASLSGKY